MSKSSFENELESRSEFFKALGHPVRLLMVNLMRVKPRHGEELAAILHLNPATISHHLSLLTCAGLLRSQKDQYYQTYSLTEAVLDRTLADILDFPIEDNTRGVDQDAYRKKVLQTFIRNGSLISIPSQLKKRQVILEKIVEQFEPGRKYTEKEVNVLLLDYHEDVATLRRGLIEHGLMRREEGIYQRVKS